jgi:hypothetical protein
MVGRSVDSGKHTESNGHSRIWTKTTMIGLSGGWAFRHPSMLHMLLYNVTHVRPAAQAHCLILDHKGTEPKGMLETQ